MKRYGVIRLSKDEKNNVVDFELFTGNDKYKWTFSMDNFKIPKDLEQLWQNLIDTIL